MLFPMLYHNYSQYSPLLDYSKWSTKLVSNNRYIIDKGTKPEHNGALFYNQSVSLNGVDQSIKSDTFGDLGADGTFSNYTMIVTANNLAGTLLNTGYTSSTGWTISYSNGAIVVISDTSNDTSFGYSVDIEGGEIVLTFNNGLAILYFNGVEVARNIRLIDTITFHPAHFLSVGAYRASSTYSSSTFSNIKLIKGITLTPAQIEYQHHYPEKFLYPKKELQQDGSYKWFPKSEILTQAELDDVIYHLPLCETDAYVRNMIGYSETVLFDDTFDVDIGNWLEARESSTLSVVNERLRVTADSTATNGASLVLSGLIVGNYYLVKSNVFSDNAGASIRFRLSLTPDLVAPVYEKQATDTDFNVYTVIKATATTMYYGTVVTGSAAGTYHELDNVSLLELTSTFKIANFTNAVRDNAINGQTGLQTCFWERDKLGVPYDSSFDRMQNDRVGYLDTGYIVTDESVVYEAVIYVNTEATSLEILGGYGANRLYMGTYLDGRAYLRYGDTSKASSVTDGYHHMSIIADKTGNVEAFVDDVSIGSEAYNFIESVPTVILGATTVSGANAMVKPIRLFEIHKGDGFTNYDNTKSYNDVLAKGLLL